MPQQAAPEAANAAWYGALLASLDAQCTSFNGTYAPISAPEQLCAASRRAWTPRPRATYAGLDANGPYTGCLIDYRGTGSADVAGAIDDVITDAGEPPSLPTPVTITCPPNTEPNRTAGFAGSAAPPRSDRARPPGRGARGAAPAAVALATALRAAAAAAAPPAAAVARAAVAVDPLPPAAAEPAAQLLARVAAVCAGPAEPCALDPDCAAGGLGCNAGGRGVPLLRGSSRRWPRRRTRRAPASRRRRCRSKSRWRCPLPPARCTANVEERCFLTARARGAATDATPAARGPCRFCGFGDFAACPDQGGGGAAEGGRAAADRAGGGAAGRRCRPRRCAGGEQEGAEVVHLAVVTVAVAGEGVRPPRATPPWPRRASCSATPRAPRTRAPSRSSPPRPSSTAHHVRRAPVVRRARPRRRVLPHHRRAGELLRRRGRLRAPAAEWCVEHGRAPRGARLARPWRRGDAERPRRLEPDGALPRVQRAARRSVALVGSDQSLQVRVWVLSPPTAPASRPSSRLDASSPSGRLLRLARHAQRDARRRAAARRRRHT